MTLSQQSKQAKPVSEGAPLDHPFSEFHDTNELCKKVPSKPVSENLHIEPFDQPQWEFDAKKNTTKVIAVDCMPMTKPKRPEDEPHESPKTVPVINKFKPDAKHGLIDEKY